MRFTRKTIKMSILKTRVMFLKEYFLKSDKCMVFKIQKMHLNALTFIYCQFNITKIIFKETIGKNNEVGVKSFQECIHVI